jgi:SAM-dependent methyltransferase
MRENIKQFVQLLSEQFDLPRPIVDIGSMQTEGQESYADLRPFFAERTYTGFDMRAGPGVDALASVHQLPFAEASVGTVLLLDTLEHVSDPLAALREATRVVRPDGIVVMSSHMNFPIHAHPSDYWRFTPMIFERMLAGLGERTVLTQGDAENPHTVIGIGMKASCDGGAAPGLLRAALRNVESRWPDMLAGGPLFIFETLDLALEQRTIDGMTPELAPGRVVAQSFICPADGMRRIDVMLADLGRLNTCRVLFRLFEGEDREREVGAYRYFAFHVTNDTWVPIPFPVQPHSSGRRYVLTVESPDASEGSAIALRSSVAKTYASGELSVDGSPVAGSLAFQVYCAPAASTASDDRVPERAAMASGAGARSEDALSRELRQLEERHWDQVRYLRSTLSASVDAVWQELQTTRAKLEELQRLQEETLRRSVEAAERSAEAVERVRVFTDSFAGRAWRRIFGSGDR